MSASDTLKKWFDELPTSEKREVIQFLYGGKLLLNEGLYMGPRPGAVYKGLFLGPVPSSSTNVCPTCGKSY
jgi:hypothetical protein